MKKIAISLLMFGTTLSVSAQQLDTEVNIQRTITPEVRAASRLHGVVPAISLPSVKTPVLSPSEYMGQGAITADMASLPEARWADTIALTPWRGYASLGYFPALDLGAELGYRFIETRDASVGGRLQYLGNKYNADLPGQPDASFYNNFVNLGADATYRFNKKSVVSLDIDYDYASIRHPLAVQGNYDQGSNDINIKARWMSAYRNINYNIGVGLGHFDYADVVPDNYRPDRKPLRQNMYSVNGGVGVTTSDSPVPVFGLDVDWTALSSNCYRLRDNLGYGYATLGETHFRPYYRFLNRLVSVTLGVNVSLATGHNDTHVRIAPDINIGYNADGAFKAYVNISGGETLNPVSMLQDINPWLYQFEAYNRTNTPVRLDAGVSWFPLNGISVAAYGGYAAIKDRLTPTAIKAAGGYITSWFVPTNMNSWLLGADVSVSLRKLLVVKAKAEIGGADKDYAGWCDWYDGARFHGRLSAVFTPIRRLDVEMSYDMRTGRRILHTLSDNTISYATIGRQCSLDLGATYTINPRLTVFGRVENLLNQQCLLISFMPARGIHGLVGASYKF